MSLIPVPTRPELELPALPGHRHRHIATRTAKVVLEIAAACLLALGVASVILYRHPAAAAKAHCCVEARKAH